MRRPLAVLALAWLATGCAQYQYSLLQPSAFGGPISADDQRVFTLDPLRYTVAATDDRLSIRVENPTADTIRLLGPESSVVDPAGRSHPLIDQTIAPRSYVVVVLPPLRPWFGATDYVEESGIGTEDYGNLSPNERQAYGAGLTGSGPHGGDPGYDRSSPVYWDWPGPGDARIHLAYRRADGSRFEHDLAVRRSKG